jgi:hypothetical protein
MSYMSAIFAISKAGADTLARRNLTIRLIQRHNDGSFFLDVKPS